MHDINRLTLYQIAMHYGAYVPEDGSIQMTEEQRKIYAANRKLAKEAAKARRGGAKE